ncbi:uncharacterized protein LOC115631915 [Scaptodrosophila lebanonensis]|uniref:Uncharacterized protein LOC115631915 n=1 Tax=Drosophila lebanonensis TaxID=7225 RepID=A0A6J2U7Z4_DROLE|nr:uncharacterized protein LOC115631915 [Scaptodrosophila lebanonensis]
MADPENNAEPNEQINIIIDPDQIMEQLNNDFGQGDAPLPQWIEQTAPNMAQTIELDSDEEPAYPRLDKPLPCVSFSEVRRLTIEMREKFAALDRQRTRRLSKIFRARQQEIEKQTKEDPEM